MTPEEAAAQIGIRLLKAVPISDAWAIWSWEKILQSIRSNGNGVVGSELILLLAYSGFHQAVHQLLQKGADIETKALDGRTALSFAASKGRKAVVRLLLEKGANTNAQDALGVTPLMCAATSGDLAMVRLMVEKGADVSMIDVRGYTMLAAGNAQDTEMDRFFRSKGVHQVQVSRS